VLGEDLAGCNLVEPVREIFAEREFSLAAVHRGSVGGHCRDDVPLAQAVVLRDLDRADDVAQAREPERVQLRDLFVTDVPAVAQVATA